MLGYFSIIGLLRVHCLLGDFTLALKTLDDIELNKKAVFAKVMAAHFTTSAPRVSRRQGKES